MVGMTKKCRYPGKTCCNRYHSHHRDKTGKERGILCRLSEWKKKRGVCPYDISIFSRTHRAKAQRDSKQMKL